MAMSEAHSTCVVAAGILTLIGFAARGYTEWRIRDEPLPGGRSDRPFVISFPKERMYWALVKRNEAKAWPLLLGYFALIGGFALFFGNVLLANSAH